MENNLLAHIRNRQMISKHQLNDHVKLKKIDMACQITFNQILHFLPTNELSMKDVGMVVISMILVKNVLEQFTASNDKVLGWL